MALVFKFGGASVKDADSVKNVASILQKYGTTPTIVVISAMGKTTNKLEELANAWFYKKGNADVVLNELKIFHLSIIENLFGKNSEKIINDI